MSAPTIQRHEPVVVLPAGAPRDEWLAARHRGIGGSDVAAMLGLDPWVSPFALYVEKTTDLVIDTENEAMRWGTLLEPVVRNEWSARTKLRVTPSPGVLAHPERPWQLVNVDGLVDDDALYEGKCVTEWKRDDWDDKIPDRTVCQVQHALDVTGRQTAHIAALVGGNRLVTATVERDEEFLVWLREREAEFWARIVEGRSPATDAHPSTREALELLYKVEPGSVRVLDPVEVLPLLDARRQAKADEKDAQARIAAADNGLKALIGTAEVAVLDNSPCFTWKHMPAVEVAATTRKAYRRLNVSKEFS